MAYDPGAIDTMLAAAIGDDPALIAELRGAFVVSAERALRDLQVAETQEDWRTAAVRLRGLAASFGAVRLMALAARAADGRAGDAAVLAKLTRMIARC